jgi:hypothetical protein
MKKVLIVLSVVLVLSLTASAASKGSWTGWITDEKCGAKDANEAKSGCAKACIGKGSKAVFVSDKDGAVLAVTNQDAVKEHAGEHVKVNGSVDEDAKSITVEKVSMVKASAKESK